ncbi:Ionotropic receptor 132 [Blattella germanica]|nr:Ionotropic receptor 132 [Blattella germanica]
MRFPQLLCLLTLTCNVVAMFPMNVTTGLIVSLYTRWNSHCVYLIHDIGNAPLLKGIRKELSELSIRTASIPLELLESILTGMTCDKKLPFLVILESNKTIKHVLEAVSQRTTLSRARWLVFLLEETVSTFLAHINIPFDCNFVVGMLSEFEVVTVTEVYRVYPTSKLSFLHLGKWSSNSGPIWASEDYDLRRLNLEGITINATVISDGTTSIVTKMVKGKPVEIGGYVGSIWRLLEHSLNFKTNFVMPGDGTFGSMMKNGSWTGMVGMVQNGFAEIGTAAFSMTTQRIQVVDYLSPLVKEKLTVFIQQPDFSDSKRNFYMNSYNYKLWLVVLAAIILLTFCLWISHFVFLQLGILDASEEVNAIELCFSIYGCFCFQGAHLAIKKCSLRIIMFVTYVTALIILATYSATFTSYLAVRNVEYPFTSFQGILEDGTFQFSALKGSAQLNYFENSKDPVLRTIYTRLIAPYKETLPSTELSGLLRLCDDRRRYAYMCGIITVNRAKNSLKCNVVPITGAFVPVTLAMIIRKNSPYRKAFNHILQKLRREGFLHRTLRNVTSTKISTKEEETVTAITIHDIAPLLALLASAVLLSCFILILECLLYHKGHRCTNILQTEFS